MASRNRGRKKPNLRDIARYLPSYDENKAVTRLLARKRTPPVTVAIMAAAMLDFQLEHLLRSTFPRRDDETWNEIIGENGPLGTFSNKIKMAYALGFFDDVIRDAFDTIRKIRNAFAHSRLLLNFDHVLVRKEFQSVSLPQDEANKYFGPLSLVRAAKGTGQQCYVILYLVLENVMLEKRLMVAKTVARAPQSEPLRG